ncbi:hypothetical protein GCM10027168_06930 [Streptomyces capparidis]
MYGSDDELDPVKVVALLRVPWPDLLREIDRSLRGWVRPCLADQDCPVETEPVMEELTVEEAATALCQAYEYATGLDGEIAGYFGESSELALQAREVDASDLEPVPRSHAAHALLASSVLALRHARDIYRQGLHRPRR